MKTEEIVDRVPDRLRPCPRCGGETKKSVLFTPDYSDLPYGWSVFVSCACGLRSPGACFIDTSVVAIDELRKQVAWWNERPIEEIHKAGFKRTPDGDGLG